MEVRQLNSQFEHAEGRLTGVIPYDSPTTITERGKTFTEVLRAGCFRSSTAGDVICTYNHQPHRLLGRVASGTLTLTDSPQGLRWSVALPEHASDVREMVARGDLSGCSFTFTTRANGERWTGSTRELVDLNLYELGPVVTPAYTQSSVAMRSSDLYRAKLELRARI